MQFLIPNLIVCVPCSSINELFWCSFFFFFFTKLKIKSVFLHWAEHSYLNRIKKKIFFFAHLEMVSTVLLNDNIGGVPLFACAENKEQNLSLILLRIYFLCIDWWCLLTLCFAVETELGGDAVYYLPSPWRLIQRTLILKT